MKGYSATYLFAFISVLCGTFGQACLKMGVKNLPLTQAIFQPWTILGFLLYGVASLFWLVVLSRLPLSSAYPLLALNFVLVLLLSAVLLKEPISLTKVIGVVFIISGIVLAGKSA